MKPRLSGSIWRILVVLMLAVACMPRAARALSSQDKARIAEMVSQSVGQWQSQRHLGVTEQVGNRVIEEYLASVAQCGAHFQALQEDIAFYVFQYLDHAREVGHAYSPTILCNPFGQRHHRRTNQYGLLRIDSDPRRYVSIDHESFDSRFDAFLLTVGEHRVVIQLDMGIACDNNNLTVPVKSGKVTQFACTMLR